jgi:hypothetical protein
VCPSFLPSLPPSLPPSFPPLLQLHVTHDANVVRGRLPGGQGCVCPCLLPRWHGRDRNDGDFLVSSSSSSRRLEEDVVKGFDEALGGRREGGRGELLLHFSRTSSFSFCFTHSLCLAYYFFSLGGSVRVCCLMLITA